MRTPEGTITEERGTPRTGKVEDTTKEAEIGAARRVIGVETVDTANFTEGDTMREKVRGKIEASLIKKQPEAISAPQSSVVTERPTTLNEADRRDLEKRFFAPSVEGLRRAFTNRGLALPTDDEILAVLLAKFTHEKLEALKRAIQVPGLLALRGNQSFGDTEALLNANKKRGGQLDVGVYGNRRTIFEEQDRVVAQKNGSQELKFSFGELLQELQDRRGKLRDIITNWQRDPLAQISRTANQDEYGQLQAQAPYLLDLTGWTMLSRKDKPEEIEGDDGLVSGGYGDWGADCRVSFTENYPGDGYYYARVRPVVMGE